MPLTTPQLIVAMAATWVGLWCILVPPLHLSDAFEARFEKAITTTPCQDGCWTGPEQLLAP
jgi:hypothetical protein